MENSIVNFLISWQSENFLGKSRFLIEFFIKNLRVFSYDLENACTCQKTTQNTPIHCACSCGHEKLEFHKILGFIAWPPHIRVFRTEVDLGQNVKNTCPKHQIQVAILIK